MVDCYIDGSAIENPGTLGSWGFLITDPWIEECGTIQSRHVTSNIAEFTALLKLLDELELLEIPKATIHSDSKLLVNTVNGAWKCRATHLKPLCKKAQSKLADHQLKWIPRQQNHMADEIANRAYSETE